MRRMVRYLELWRLQRPENEEVSRYGYQHVDDENYFFPLAVIGAPLGGIEGNIPNIRAF